MLNPIQSQQNHWRQNHQRHLQHRVLLYPRIGSKSWMQNQIDIITLIIERKPPHGIRPIQQSQHHEWIEQPNQRRRD